jgi:DnaJ-class molecular chaperone
MAARKKTPTAPPAELAPPECSVCKGAGTVAVSVRVGRSRRVVGSQDGMCLSCLGTGTA